MSISVIDPISPSFSRTGLLLFRPFKFKRWFVLALPAWLWLLGEGSGGFNFNNNSSSRGGGRGGPGGPGGGGGGDDFVKVVQHGWDFFLSNMAWIIPVALLFLLVIIAIWLFLRWISSRGTFMFFDNIVNNDTRIKVPWADFKTISNSLFKFRICWDLLWIAIWFMVIGISSALLWSDFHRALLTGHYDASGLTVAGLLFLFVTGLFLALAGWILNSIIFRLAVPAMYIRRMNAWPAVKMAWRELFVPHLGVCLLYFLSTLRWPSSASSGCSWR